MTDRVWGLAALAMLAWACSGGMSGIDAGSPPPPREDAGSGQDAGRAEVDAGSDASVTPIGCTFDGGPSADAGPCTVCGSATACGPAGSCRFVAEATCLGQCALFGDPCERDGPLATTFSVIVEVDSFSCPQRHAEGCDFVHHVDPASGKVTLSLVLRGADGGVTRPFGTWDTPELVAALSDAAVRSLWCVGERDFFAERCVDRSPLVVVSAATGDAGVVGRWPVRAGHLPPRALSDAVDAVLRAGDRVFRDAGVAWSRSPP